MALLETYEDQYRALMSEVNAKIDKLKQLHAAGATGQEAWAKTTAAVQRDIEDADEVLGKIAMETRSVKGDLKASLQAKVKQHKIDLATCKETVDSLARKQKEASERADLLRGGNGVDLSGELSLSNEHRARLTQATDKMAAGADRLKESRKVARDTEMVAVDIMEDLRQQRETLLHARDSAGEVSENLAESRKLVKMIQRRMAQNKCFMYGVVVMVAGITLSLILLQLVPSSPANAEKPASPSDVPG